ncbi:MAG: M67 family metallopeptidase [Vicinamibacterales bacterium]
MVLERGTEAGIRTHAAAAYPHECCGALLGRVDRDERIITEAWPIANGASDRARRFTVSAGDYQGAETRARLAGLALLGFYHSHPDAPAAPSQEDLARAWPNFNYIIVSVVKAMPAELTCWRLREDRSAFEREDITWPTAF